MSFLDSMKQFNVSIPSQEESYQMLQQSQPSMLPVDPASQQWEWQRRYDSIRSQTNFALGGYISPYEGNGWGGNPLVMNNLERMFIAANESKLDPMRMFTSETTQLRTIGADQAKILRLFEAKLKESLTEKGKFGLNEMDIEGLQALTAGKNVLIASVKEQVAIQAKKAELKIKQQQAANAAMGSGSSGGRSSSDGIDSSSPYGFGRSFIDNIFDTTLPDASTTNIPASVGTVSSPEDATSFLEGFNVSDNIKNEAAGYTLKVIVDGDDDSSARYAMVDSNDEEVNLSGQILPDSSNITINHDINKAYGDGMVSYDIIRKY
ncbi:MAG: hypothetical protein IKU29_07900 [Parabacteroides sp.]|nr:hypothetical protein [Parabacteroides sp.]